MVDVNDYIQSKYLGVSDLKGKEPVVVIARIGEEDMRDGKKKLAIFIANHPKGILLNVTNTKAIASLYGNETDNWIGKKIRLVAVWTEYQGKPTQGLRIVPPGVEGSAPAPMAQPPRGHPAGFDDLDGDVVPF